jgi:mono/diheme cytochrome c family protein
MHRTIRAQWACFLSLLAGLGWCAGAGLRVAAQPPTKAARTTSAISLEKASPVKPATRRQYRQLCARCHGDDLAGGELRARGQKIPDFTRAAFHQVRTDAELRVSILEGKGTRMPPFAGKVSEEQSRDLVRLIRSANPERATTDPADATKLEGRFAELEKEMEALRKEFKEIEQSRRKDKPMSR